MSKLQLIQGDCLIKLKELDDNSIDSIVTDPPYHLVSIVKRFGKEGSAPAQFGTDGAFSRVSKGFMGKDWDGVNEDGIGIAQKVELWKECLRVLKPGGYLLAFGGTRTYHRMASAIEDAGFEIRDMIEWVYGSGFPKSLNIGKAVDRLQGNEREDLGYNDNSRTNKPDVDVYEAGIRGKESRLTKGTSEWEGWGTALKPSHEPICMARKPIQGTVATNCLKWGTCGINIDESRVELTDNDPNLRINPVIRGKQTGNTFQSIAEKRYEVPRTFNNTGRFPANLLHDNSEEVRECFPNESERFFKSIIYTAKASKSERNKGCEGLEEKQSVGGGGGIGDYLDDVNSASGKYGSEKAPAKNNHPTVKPIALMEYLIKMVTPKGGIVLDPFMGSGTTGIACRKLNYGFIGIELEPDYITIAKARIDSIKAVQEKLL